MKLENIGCGKQLSKTKKCGGSNNHNILLCSNCQNIFNSEIKE